jgi:hypothetical protein
LENKENQKETKSFFFFFLIKRWKEETRKRGITTFFGFLFQADMFEGV